MQPKLNQPTPQLLLDFVRVAKVLRRRRPVSLEPLKEEGTASVASRDVRFGGGDGEGLGFKV